MADQWYDLPDGSEINIPDNTTPDQLRFLFDRLSEEFPDSIGRTWSTYGQEKEEEEDEGNIFGALYQAVENLPRGAASVPLMGAQGIAALLTPHKDTDIEKNLRGARDWLYSGIAPEYRDSKIAGIGLGVGQMAPLMLGGAALAKLGVGAAVPGMLANRGISMTSPAMKLLGGAKGVQNIAAGSLMSIPMHYGQYASALSDYEQRTGEDVSALKELAGLPPSVGLGIFEMLPLAMMPGVGAASRAIAAQVGAGFAEKGALSVAKSFLTGAATETIQESTAELGQMAMARALYDDEALADYGSRMWDAGIIGGGAGGIVSVLTNLAIRGGAGGAWGLNAAAEDAIQREENLRGGRPSLVQRRDRTDQEKLDANRREYHRQALLSEEARREKETPETETFVPLWTTPEELDALVEEKFEESKAKEAAKNVEAQEAEAIAREEVGVTFLELDKVKDKSAEEIKDLFQTGEISAETYNALILADRLSNVGDESRNDLREFALRNAEAINGYSPALVATAILAGHPDVDTGAKTSSELFGERSEMAVGMLAPLLSPEFQALLGQRFLSPAEINIIVGDASARIEGFNAKETDRLIYDFRGNTDLYARVNRNHQEQVAAWSEGDGGQLELNIPDPNEQDATTLVRETAAKAPASWNSDATLRDNISKLLLKKNILLNQDRKTGGVNFKSEAFQALVERVTGHTNLDNLTPGQRKALYGHIYNLPTFDRPTQLPDLSKREYSAVQAAALLEVLEFAREGAIATGKDSDKWVNVFDQVGVKKKRPVAPAPVAPKLPKDLAGGAPRYIDTTLEFDSDVDRAAYIVANRRGRPSERDADYLGWLAEQGMDLDAAKAHGNRVKEFIKTNVSDQDTFTVPAQIDMTPVTPDETTGVEPLRDMDQALQLIRHLVEAGYVTTGMSGKKLRVHLNNNTRPSVMEAVDAAVDTDVDATTDQERQALEEEANRKTKTEKQLVSKIELVKRTLRAQLDRFSLPGLDFMLAADVDSIYDAMIGLDGIIPTPESMDNSVAMLDGPNAKLWISLSQIDPDGTRSIKDIIQDITEEVIHAYEQEGYWYENELNTMDSRALNTVVPASVSEQGHKDGLNFVQFAEKLYPDLNQQDMMSEARAKYMTALAKGQIPKGKTAGKVGNLKEKIISFLTAGVESGRDAEMQSILSILHRFQSGDVGRRGPSIPGHPRSLRLSRYADPRHIRELKKAIEEGDTEAEQRIAQDILDEKKFDMAQSAPPELTWRDKLFNQFAMDQELADTNPGEIPLIGINASDRALNEYFRQKRGEPRYTMPEAIKHKLRNQERWAPSKELEDLVNSRTPKAKTEPVLGSEIVIDSMSKLDAFDALMNDPKWDQMTEKEQFKATRKIVEEYANVWSEGFLKAPGKYWRYSIADGGYPVEELGQMKDRATTGIRSLADTSAVAMLRWRDSVGNVMNSVLRLGGISWIGDPLDGTHVFDNYGPEQETLLQAFAHLQSAQDREYATEYSAAKRFLDMTRKRLNGEAQAALELAEATDNQANIGFFKQQVKDRKWDVNLTTDEQIAKAEEAVTRIEAEAPHIAEFSKSYQGHNKRSSLPWLLSTGQITQEMYDYLQDMTYVPLYKDVGTAKSWPLGSNGRGEGRGKSRQKSFEFGRMIDREGNVFDHALEDFDSLKDIDLIRGILNSEMAMLRDGFTNLAARRVVRDTQELTERGYGIQSKQVDKAGPNVIRIMVNGQQEFHELADPLLANSIMTMGFAGTNNFLRAGRIGAQVLRWGIVNFPMFIYKNFARDARQVNTINAAAKPSFSPLFGALRRAMDGDVLQKSLESGLITGSGLYPSVQEQVGGMTALQEVLEGDSALAKGLRAMGFKRPGERIAKQAKMQKQYEEVSAELKEGRMPLKNVSDYFAYMRVMYRNLQEIGESTSRLGAHDTVLAGTGNMAEAMLAGLETHNFGRHGASPVVNAVTSMIPFMSGAITGTDTFVRSWTNSPDAVGKNAVDPNMTDEAASALKFRLMNRALFALVPLLVYYMMMRDDEGYKRAGEQEKMNNFLIPVGDKYFKVPTSFASGAILKSIPESILRLIDEEDYTPADVGKEALDQVKRNLGFTIVPQMMRPMWQAMKNEDDFMREPIVPRHMEDLPSEHQRTPYTSNSAARLASIFGALPGVDTLSSPMKMEFMIRQYFGQAGLYAMLVSDRIAREYTGENVVGTRYDWAPSSLLTGEGIENVPVIGDVISRARTNRGDVDKFYALKDEVDIYVSVLNKLRKEGSREDVQKWIEDNIDTRNHRDKVRAFGTYMTKWRQRRTRLLRSDWIADERKRELLFDMIEERDRMLDGLTSVKAGIRGLAPYNWERDVI